MLLAHYMLKSLTDRDELPKNSAVIKTIVTTEGVRKIVESFGAELIDTLTGFKYIGEKLKNLKKLIVIHLSLDLNKAMDI